MPALVAKAEAPTKGACRFGARLSISSSARETWVSSPSCLVVDADLEAVGEGGLQLQGADQRHEIGVAAALAEAVERALDLARAGLDRRERIGDRAAAIVMGVNAEAVAGHDLRGLGDDARATSSGKVPPLVSQSTTQRAPAS